MMVAVCHFLTLVGHFLIVSCGPYYHFWNQNNENGPTKAQLGSIAVNSECCGLEYISCVNVQFCLLL